jgi:hypothetical protein
MIIIKQYIWQYTILELVSTTEPQEFFFCISKQGLMTPLKFRKIKKTVLEVTERRNSDNCV